MWSGSPPSTHCSGSDLWLSCMLYLAYILLYINSIFFFMSRKDMKRIAQGQTFSVWCSLPSSRLLCMAERCLTWLDSSALHIDSWCVQWNKAGPHFTCCLQRALLTLTDGTVYAVTLSVQEIALCSGTIIYLPFDSRHGQGKKNARRCGLCWGIGAQAHTPSPPGSLWMGADHPTATNSQPVIQHCLGARG